MKKNILSKVAIAAVGACILSTAYVFNATSADSAVDRGKYIVNNVGMCTDCHGPQLKGQPLPFKPTIDMPWAPIAPSLRQSAIKRKYDEAKLTRFLVTHKTYNGKPLRPPMPAYHLNQLDAQAVSKYITSLK